MTRIMTSDSTIQRITRLTPLEAVLALVDAQIKAVKPQIRPMAMTEGYALAEDVVAPKRPEHPIALRDGFAVASAAFGAAGPYTPVPLLAPVCRIDVAEALPAGADAVLPVDAVVFRGERAEAVAPVMAGEGVLPAGGDAASGALMRRTGERMRSIYVAAAEAAGIKSAAVRNPSIAVVLGVEPTRRLGGMLTLLYRAVFDAGATVSSERDMTLEVAVKNESNDAIIAIGGTGSGRHDKAVHALARLGRVEMHGIAISPGETTAFGFAGERPVLLVSGRLDAALAAWLLIGRHIAAKLAGTVSDDNTMLLPLRRKLSSAIGMTEVVPVRCQNGMAEPLASGYLSFMTLAQSNGWIEVPAASEGFAEGTPVAVNPWP